MAALTKSLILVFAVALVAVASTPRVGEAAPEFTLPAHTGGAFSLASFTGKSNLVLVFYRGYW